MASIEWMLARAGDGGGMNKRRRYIFYLGSFLNYILDNWDFCSGGRPIQLSLQKI